MASVIGLHTCPELILSNYEAADRFQVIRELGQVPAAWLCRETIYANNS